MTARSETAGRSKKKMAVVGSMLATAITSLVLLTEFPTGLASGTGASAALAELVARSPGARVGGIALKEKTKRTAPVALVRGSSSTGTPTPGLGAPIASVMGAGPAGPLGAAPYAPGVAPGEVLKPGAGIPAIAAAPVAGGGLGFVPIAGGGGFIVGPGGGVPGGGGNATAPGAASSPVPEPTPSPTVTPPVVVTTPTPTPTTPAAVPEPATWFMLIAGFGFVGGALRRRRPVRHLA